MATDKFCTVEVTEDDRFCTVIVAEPDKFCTVPVNIGVGGTFSIFPDWLGIEPGGDDAVKVTSVGTWYAYIDDDPDEFIQAISSSGSDQSWLIVYVKDLGEQFFESASIRVTCSGFSDIYFFVDYGLM